MIRKAWRALSERNRSHLADCAIGGGMLLVVLCGVASSGWMDWGSVAAGAVGVVAYTLLGVHVNGNDLHDE